jgi:hypothetical protein
MRWLARFGGLAALAAVAACRASGSGEAGSGDDVQAAECPAFNAPGRLPATPAEAQALRAKGASWTNREIRARYVCAALSIGAANEEWKAQGLAAAERAKRAFQARHDARITARAMMAKLEEVKLLEERDLAKYGHPDGPTFEWLVEHAQKKGLVGDAVFEEIVQTAQRTDAATNKALGL